ncbi:MAG TPA: DUF2249 domain-containing protein, partial [Chitinophagaceae bacterium]
QVPQELSRTNNPHTMTINANTKIAAILKQDARALDALVSISPKFEKLRNPLLRKVMAGRTTLTAASKLGGCQVEDFYTRLEPLGFRIDRDTKPVEEPKKPMPAFINSLNSSQLVTLDVRPVIASGSDPLNLIMEKVKSIDPGQALKIINTFEPTPLILMLEKKGFETWVDTINDNLVETWFYKKGPTAAVSTEAPVANDWQHVLQGFGGRITEVDVRHLEMPQPMLTILAALDELKPGTALYVYHKRIPVFLLPELRQRNFDYRIKEITDGEVHLLVFSNNGDHSKQ